MRIVFATWPTAEYQRRLLSEQGAMDRLLSYWFLVIEDPEMAKEYAAETIETNKNPKRRRRWDSGSYLRRRRLGVIRHILEKPSAEDLIRSGV